ncbi:MAG TPA: Crp/Fnr family transcriptional regulator [Burkholderiaceae bacterium]|nr:Crp/Fnr family transcriptional regulator [Burkholderiaceae bacterium]
MPTSSRPATAARRPPAPRCPPHPPLSAQIDASANSLLAALPAPDWQQWSKQLEWVAMPFGQVVYDAGSPVTHVYFPTTAVVSMLVLMANGDCAEAATIGNDGVVGVPLMLGGMSTIGRAVVQVGGHAYRLKSEVVTETFNRGGAAMHLLLCYSQTLLTQMAQNAACNRHHTVDQQVCRLILMNLDRVKGNLLQLTQELLAGKLGVRRESVTEVALALQRAGLIRYARGSIEVLDRDGLEQRACECYGVVKGESLRLLQLAGTNQSSTWNKYRTSIR